MSKVSRKIIKESIENVWHPCSRMDQYNDQNLIAIESGNKSWLRSVDGKGYFDAISSWWVNLFGHNNPFLKKNIITQLNKIEHVMLSGMTHQPVIELSKRLNTFANMDHCFYSSDGSSAVEVALKVSYHYWKNKGQKKTKFALLENSYHGETLGALSVTDVDAIQANAKELFERLTVLKYLALERLADGSKNDISSQESLDSEDAEIQPIKIKIGNPEEKVPENQTNLLDAIEESGVELEQSDAENLNQKLASASKSVADKLKAQPIPDLNTAIGINQKYLFMNDLFEGERDEFHNSIAELNKFDSFLDADNYIRNNLVSKYNWDMESASAVRFMELIERRYLS